MLKSLHRGPKGGGSGPPGPPPGSATALLEELPPSLKHQPYMTTSSLFNLGLHPNGPSKCPSSVRTIMTLYSRTRVWFYLPTLHPGIMFTVVGNGPFHLRDNGSTIFDLQSSSLNHSPHPHSPSPSLRRSVHPFFRPSVVAVYQSKLKSKYISRYFSNRSIWGWPLLQVCQFLFSPGEPTRLPDWYRPPPPPHVVALVGPHQYGAHVQMGPEEHTVQVALSLCQI